MSLEFREANRFPVFAARDGTGITCRYNRLWLERGANRMNEARIQRGLRTVDDALLAPAVDAVETALESAPRLWLKLQKGDLVYVDNHKILHARTAYRDSGASRVMSRVWIRTV